MNRKRSVYALQCTLYSVQAVESLYQMNRKRSMYTVQYTLYSVQAMESLYQMNRKRSVYTVQCTGRGIAISDEQKEECVHCTVYRPWNGYIR